MGNHFNSKCKISCLSFKLMRVDIGHHVWAADYYCCGPKHRYHSTEYFELFCSQSIMFSVGKDTLWQIGQHQRVCLQYVREFILVFRWVGSTCHQSADMNIPKCSQACREQKADQNIPFCFTCSVASQFCQFDGATSYISDELKFYQLDSIQANMRCCLPFHMAFGIEKSYWW